MSAAAEPFRRWADLLARQLDALVAGDFDAFLGLAPETEAAALDARAGDGAPDLALLHACAARLDAVQQHVRALRDAARTEILELDARGPALRRYSTTAPAGHLDVRF